MDDSGDDWWRLDSRGCAMATKDVELGELPSGTQAREGDDLDGVRERMIPVKNGGDYSTKKEVRWVFVEGRASDGEGGRALCAREVRE